MEDIVNMRKRDFFCVKAEEEEKIFTDVLLNQSNVIK